MISLRCPHAEIVNAASEDFLSDCANAQVDLNLGWAYMSKGTFSDVAALISIITADLGESIYLNDLTAILQRQTTSADRKLLIVFKTFQNDDFS